MADEEEGRDQLDRFYTPNELAEVIVRRALELAPGAIGKALEPSSGKGAFLRAMRFHANPSSLHAVDLDPDAGAHASAEVARAIFACQDFLTIGQRELGGFFDLICGNPPFARPMRDTAGAVIISAKTGKPKMEPIARDHVEKMLGLLNPDGGVCSVLLRASFLSTADRAPLFRACPPAFIDFVVERPSFTEGGTDNHEYAVITWQRLSPRRWLTPTKARWLSWKK